MTDERQTVEESREAEEREPRLEREEIKDLAPDEDEAGAVRGGHSYKCRGAGEG